MRLFSISIVILGLLLAARPAQAVIMLSGPGDFSGSATLIDFEGLGLADNAPIPGTIDGVTFQLSNTSAPYFRAEGAGGAIDNHGANPFVPNDMTVSFASYVNQVGFGMKTFSTNPVNITLKKNGSVVESFSVAGQGSAAYHFYGWKTNNSFDEFLIDVSYLFALDDLRAENVPQTPAPTSLAIWSVIGGIGFWFRRRKSRRQG